MYESFSPKIGGVQHGTPIAATRRLATYPFSSFHSLGKQISADLSNPAPRSDLGIDIRVIVSCCGGESIHTAA